MEISIPHTERITRETITHEGKSYLREQRTTIMNDDITTTEKEIVWYTIEGSVVAKYATGWGWTDATRREDLDEPELEILYREKRKEGS
jgi:hypothetical protein